MIYSIYQISITSTYHNLSEGGTEATRWRGPRSCGWTRRGAGRAAATAVGRITAWGGGRRRRWRSACWRRPRCGSSHTGELTGGRCRECLITLTSTQGPGGLLPAPAVPAGLQHPGHHQVVVQRPPAARGQAAGGRSVTIPRHCGDQSPDYNRYPLPCQLNCFSIIPALFDLSPLLPQ